MSSDGNISNGLQISVGAVMLARFNEDNFYECKIIDKREKDKDFEYYVHFTDLDRRLDRWIQRNDLKTITNDTGGPGGGPKGLSSPLAISLSPTSFSQSSFSMANGLNHTSSISLGPNSNSLNSLSSGGPALSPQTRRLTRLDKRKMSVGPDSTESAPLDPTEAALEKEHEERTKVKNIERIIIGKYDLDCWYYSPFPDPYRNQSQLYICEFCLKYAKYKKTMDKHQSECRFRHPPGNEIYRDGDISVFEVDGEKHKIYCQCLCLVAKLFIDHKTLYYDVEPFLFYILTEKDSNGHQVVAYFSKEKHSADNYNVACILTFPQYQRRGFGKFLITLSYELSLIENKVGSPEKPLSDLGKISYRSYWTMVLLDQLSRGYENVTIADLSKKTAIKKEDVIATLQHLQLVRYHKGEHILAIQPKLLEQHQQRQAALNAKEGNKKGIVSFDRTKLKWTPPITSTTHNNKRRKSTTTQ